MGLCPVASIAQSCQNRNRKQHSPKQGGGEFVIPTPKQYGRPLSYPKDEADLKAIGSRLLPNNVSVHFRHDSGAASKS